MLMRLKLHIFYLFILLIHCFGIAQNKQYNLSKVKEKVFEFHQKNSDSLIFYAKHYEKLGKDRCEKAQGLLLQSRGYYQKSEFQKSEAILATVIDSVGASSSECEKKSLNDVYRRLFYIKKQQGDYKKALLYIQKRAEVVERLSVKDGYYHKNILDISKCKASIKRVLGLYDESLTILLGVNKKLNALKLNNEDEGVIRNFELEKANVLNLLGTVYLHLSSDYPKKSFLDSASVCFRKAYNISNRMKHMSSETEAFYSLRNADIQIKKKDYPRALQFIDKYDSLFRVSSSSCKNGFYLRKALIFHKIKVYDSSIVNAMKFLNLEHNQFSSSKAKLTLYNNLANSYALLKQNDSALKYSNLTLKTYKELEKNKTTAIKSLYEIELTDAKKLNDILVRNKQANYWKIVAIACVVLLSLGYVIFSSIKKKQNVIVSKEEQLAVKEDKSSKSDSKIDSNVVSEILKGLSEFEKTTMYLDENFNSNVLADYLNTNTTYLSQVVNQHKEKTFKHYITDLRIQYVIEKLHSDKKFQKYSIESIGKEIGYSNASAFTRAFKKKMGVTPSQYIKDKVKNS